MPLVALAKETPPFVDFFIEQAGVFCIKDIGIAWD